MGPVSRDTQARAAFKPNKTPAGAYWVDKSQGLAGAPPSSDVHGQVEWLRRNVCPFFLSTPPADGSTTCARGSCVCHHFSRAELSAGGRVPPTTIAQAITAHEAERAAKRAASGNTSHQKGRGGQR